MRGIGLMLAMLAAASGVGSADILAGEGGSSASDRADPIPVGTGPSDDATVGPARGPAADLASDKLSAGVAAPDAGTALLVCAGMIGLLLRARRRRTQAAGR